MTERRHPMHDHRQSSCYGDTGAQLPAPAGDLDAPALQPAPALHARQQGIRGLGLPHSGVMPPLQFVSPEAYFLGVRSPTPATSPIDPEML
jgi:hypothetical protein